MLAVPRVEVIDKLAALDWRSRLPHEQRADRVLPQNRIKEPARLLFAPHKRALNAGKPKTSIFIRIVEKIDDLAERMLWCFHGASRIAEYEATQAWTVIPAQTKHPQVNCNGVDLISHESASRA